MDDAGKTAISISGIVGLAIVLGIGMIIYGCQISNQQYYDMAHSCIAAGGSFIPTGNNGSAVCVKPNSSP
jgi:hypothetical protein